MIIKIIKYFFLILTSTYCYRKLPNLKLQSVYVYNWIFFLLISTLIISSIPQRIIFTTPFLLTFLVYIFCKVAHKTDFRLNLSLSILSVAISYFLYAISMILLLPVCAIPYYFSKNFILNHLLPTILIGMLQFILIFCFFRIKRFRKGLPDIEKHLSSDIAFFISIIILLIEPTLYLAKSNLPITLLLILFVIILGLILYLCLRKYISSNYLAQTRNRKIENLENTINEQQVEIEKLSKLIHKDNKLLAAFELSVRETLSEHPSDQTEQLLQEITTLSEDRKGILQHQAQENFDITAKTNIASTDIILKYFCQRAGTEGILFQVSLADNLNYMVTDIITEQDFNTLLADLIENAFISMRNQENRNALLVTGVENVYYFSIFDSGSLFDSEVIARMGKERYTTHKKEGGSGIGLMQTFELLKKYNASFEMEELSDGTYTKRVSVYFDFRSEVRISSVRPDMVSVSKEREDILFA